MNWLTKGKYGLAALSALFLISCDDEELLSLDFNPQDENIDLSFTELTLPYQLVQLDSIATTNVDRLLVGNYQSDDFGTVRSIGYINMGLGSLTSSAESDDELDSLVLVMVRNYFYGDARASLQQELEIRRLSEPFNDTITYFSSSSIPYETARTPLASSRFSANPLEADTVRVRMDEMIGNDLLDKLKNNAVELDSNALFQDYFRGLALVPSSENQFMTGFSRVQMLMYYSAPGDTASKTFSFVANKIFNGVETNRSATALAEINEPLEAVTPTDDRLYLQSYTGLIPRIDFQPLQDFVANNDDRILLNSVTLHIGLTKLEAGKDPPVALAGYLVQDDGVSRILSTFANAQRNLFFYGMYEDSEYFYDQLGRQPVPREASPLVYDSANMAYDLRVTSFTQTMLDGFVENSEILIYPNDLNSSVTQLITSADSLKLRVYYTRLR